MTERERSVTVIGLLRRTVQHMVSELVERLAAAGYPDISGTHHPVFQNIDLAGTRLTVLAARADLTHQSMSELVRTLEHRGYLERRPDPSDGRARLVRLTAKGLRMIRQASHEIELMEKQWETYWREAGGDSDWRAVLKEALARHEAESEKRLVQGRTRSLVDKGRDPA